MKSNFLCRPAIAVLGLAAFLGGCSAFFGDEGVFRSRQKDYLQANPIAPIKVPSDLDSSAIAPLFVVPEISATDEFGDPLNLVDYTVPRPHPIADSGEVGVKIQKLQGERWIFLNASTAQVWPRTQNFMSEYGLNVATSNARDGLIETSWVEFKDNKTTKSRYRIHIAKGIHPDTTEIHVVQVERPFNTAESQPVSWPLKSDNEEREGWLLDELASVLALSVDNNSASLLGQNVGGRAKVEFLENTPEPTLQIRLTNARAWATLSHALKREGFVQWANETDLGVFYVGYSKFEDKKRGLFSRLAFWKDHYVAPEAAPHSLDQVISHLSPESGSILSLKGFASGEPLRDGDGYLVLLNQKDSAVDVVIRDHRGMPLTRQKSKNMLRIIRNNLI